MLVVASGLRRPGNCKRESSGRLMLESGDSHSSSILATGVTWRRLAIEGFDQLIGKGLYYGAVRSTTLTARWCSSIVARRTASTISAGR